MKEAVTIELEGGQLRFHNNIDTFEKLYNQIKVFLSKNENFSLGVTPLPKSC